MRKWFGGKEKKKNINGSNISEVIWRLSRRENMLRDKVNEKCTYHTIEAGDQDSCAGGFHRLRKLDRTTFCPLNSDPHKFAKGPKFSYRALP